jgi:RNA polymerase sigma-70 factor, ECF subfamily
MRETPCWSDEALAWARFEEASPATSTIAAWLEEFGGRTRMGLAWTSRAGVTTGALEAMERVDAPASLRELAAAAARDTQARDVLLARVRDMALKYARVRLGRFGAEDTAQDVAQEVCMAVMTALPTYEERGLPFEAFVYTITSRKLADAQRAAMRGPTPVCDIPDEVDDSLGPESMAVMRDQAASALSLMQRLPVQQREVLTLRVAVGLSTEETAAALGMSPGAIRVAQHRALTKLRAMLAETNVRGVS